MVQEVACGRGSERLDCHNQLANFAEHLLGVQVSQFVVAGEWGGCETGPRRSPAAKVTRLCHPGRPRCSR